MKFNTVRCPLAQSYLACILISQRSSWTSSNATSLLHWIVSVHFGRPRNFILFYFYYVRCHFVWHSETSDGKIKMINYTQRFYYTSSLILIIKIQLQEDERVSIGPTCTAESCMEPIRLLIFSAVISPLCRLRNDRIICRVGH